MFIWIPSEKPENENLLLTGFDFFYLTFGQKYLVGGLHQQFFPKILVS